MAKLDKACVWLEELGIAYSRTRIGRYKDLFEVLAKHQLADTLNAFYEEYTLETWVNAAHEVAELNRIYDGLNGQSSPELVSRLKDALKGHELYVLDSEHRSGRDFSFELSIAAKFVSAGLVVDFGHEADLRVLLDDFTFFVECKRLKSPHKIQKRIKEGLKQLHKRYVKSENPLNARGMLALSIGKTVNEKLGLLEGRDPNELGQKAFNHNRAFIEKYKSYWQSNPDQRTIGTAVVLDTPGRLIDNKQLATVHEVAMNNCVPTDTMEYQLLLSMAECVFKERT
ncbi:hypothetical protein QZJ86_19985 [Methylomonas montana]|uniref:hypothetical protein n=1 Tax=Methylomonas montana TaxID=3058963 RepID=UPI002657F572|nr:hypothetical protein [Methylomonas montana]WKJ90262.1 hypothetical protein QZJ86_19985 [Methylomonas montana]